MPARRSATRLRQERRKLAIESGTTNSSSDFAAMCRQRPERIGIVAEGDSWFAYPRKWILFGPDMNVVDHIATSLRGTGKANMIQLASNGDEAVNMTTGSQKQRLYDILKKNRDYIRLILFSGGGNDIVGKNDLLPLLNDYQPGMDALACIDAERFERKIESIVLAYYRLVEMCSDVVPGARVVAHTYDIPKPENSGAEFYWGLIKTKPWIYPYMQRKGIPRDLQLPVIRHMLECFGARLQVLADEPMMRNKIIVVDTQGTLRPGHNTDWENEIHPTGPGFKRITRKIYAGMLDLEPGLPPFK